MIPFPGVGEGASFPLEVSSPAIALELPIAPENPPYIRGVDPDDPSDP